MELKDNKTAASDDEDDLEKLRLAALQSLRRTASEETQHFQKKSPQNQHKRRPFQGRNVRNGQFYNNRQQKNTNLISIPTVSDESVSDVKPRNNKFTEESKPKLILPQDRYCNAKANDEKPTEAASKFDRYDNSDKSESESEYEENSESESESPGKLQRSDSLEALMQELENEIQGDSKPKEEKVKVKVKKRKMKPTVEKVEEKEEIREVPEQEEEKVVEEEKQEEKIEENVVKNEVKIEPKTNTKFRNIETKRSPLNKRFFNKKHDRNVHNMPNFRHQPYVPHIYSENSFNQSSMPFNPHIPYNNLIANPPPLVPLNMPPDYAHPLSRPLSPLNLNTDDVLTITRAPLSPRSAAFVLQNREIVERRKKSPRRSYSRSPSPRYRRSKSPPLYRRSLSPPRKFMKSKSRSPHPLNLENNRKLSPIKDRVDPPRDRRTPPVLDRRSPLPKTMSPGRDRRSPMRGKLSPLLRQRYPDRKSPIPRRATPIDRSPKQNYRTSPKASVKERLGNRNRQNTEVPEESIPKPTRKRSRSISLSPEPQEELIEENPSEILFDPILEARRKKFESNEIKTTEGIIRLKPKVEVSEENEEVKMEESVNEDDLLDIFATAVDDIFSDEETDEENEGRFKSNLNTKRNVSVLPFTQLTDTSTRNVKTEALKTNQNSSSRSERSSNRKRQRSRSPCRNHKERIKDSGSKRSSTKDKLYARNRILFRNGSSRKEKGPVSVPIESKKIEIKIRNPSKYETSSKYDVANELETLERIDKSVRKVEVAEVIKKEGDVDLESVDAEIVVDSPEDVSSDVQSNQKCEAGDLRAQLSRKRAERQNKLPLPEDVQSRLLQNALQGAVFKKPKKSRKEKDSAPKEYAAVKRTATITTNFEYGVMKFKTTTNQLFSGVRKVKFLYSDTEPIGDYPDGKLPIHLRLGFANSMDIFQESKVKRKRSKSKGRIEQV